MEIVIKAHSFVDVITNSSSELFVCDSTKSIDFVKEILVNYEINEIVNVYVYTEELYKQNILDYLNNGLDFMKYYVQTYIVEKLEKENYIEEHIQIVNKDVNDILTGTFDFKENDFKNKSNIGNIIISAGDSCNLIKDTISDEKYEELLNILNAKEYK